MLDADFYHTQPAEVTVCFFGDLVKLIGTVFYAQVCYRSASLRLVFDYFRLAENGDAFVKSRQLFRKDIITVNNAE